MANKDHADRHRSNKICMVANEDIMYRAAAARCFVDAAAGHDSGQNRAREFRAFMGVFFPDFDQRLVDDAAREIRDGVR